MPDEDTSAKAVEQTAEDAEWRGELAAAATLRALLTERDAARAEAARLREAQGRFRRQGNSREWRCFHCDEVFITEAEARDHFGFDCSCDVACRIKAREERGLLRALRDAEENVARLVSQLHEENGEAMKQLRRVQHQIGVYGRDAEQAGYDRALRDVEAGRVEPEYARRILAALTNTGDGA